MNTNSHVCIRPTGDPYIDRYVGQQGELVDTREVDDGGYRYTQVAIRFGGEVIWVNEDEYEPVN